jgi:SNF2 family DNA or RNA helicase
LELYEQVIGRLLRSGQTKDVWCYRLMTRKTVDYRILDALKGKADLSELAMEALC